MIVKNDALDVQKWLDGMNVPIFAPLVGTRAMDKLEIATLLVRVNGMSENAVRPFRPVAICQTTLANVFHLLTEDLKDGAYVIWTFVTKGPEKQYAEPACRRPQYLPKATEGEALAILMMQAERYWPAVKTHSPTPVATS